MGNGKKIFGIILLLLALVSFVLYFVVGETTIKFKVKFDSDGGTSVKEQVIKKGEKAEKPQDPTKEKSEFVEWQLDGIVYNFDNPVTKDITLKAVWLERDMYSVKVTLDGKEYKTSVMEDGYFVIDTLNLPEKEGFIIKIYDSNNEEFDFNELINKNLELTAKYVEAKTFIVTFDSNGGSIVKNVSVKERDIVSEPDVTKEGYTLEGWYLNNEIFDFGTPITSNITLQAKWVKNK